MGAQRAKATAKNQAAQLLDEVLALTSELVVPDSYHPDEVAQAKATPPSPAKPTQTAKSPGPQGQPSPPATTTKASKKRQPRKSRPGK